MSFFVYLVKKETTNTIMLEFKRSSPFEFFISQSFYSMAVGSSIHLWGKNNSTLTCDFTILYKAIKSHNC